MNRSFARTLTSTPRIRGTGGALSFEERIWRGVGAGEESETSSVANFMIGACVGVVGVIAWTHRNSKLTGQGVVPHLEGTLKGMKRVFGVSS